MPRVGRARKNGRHLTTAIARNPRPRTAPSTPRPAKITLAERLAKSARREYTAVYLVAGSTFALLSLGLLMVLSASSVDSYLSNDGVFGVFAKQALAATIGVVLLLLAWRMPAKFWKRWAGTILVVGAALQFLVFTGMGYSSGGNRNWLTLGPITIQPSEFIKLGLALWMGITMRRAVKAYGTNSRQVLTPAILVAAVVMGLVLLGGDLGTTGILALIAMATLYFAGVSWRVMGLPVVAGGVVMVIMTLVSPNRMERVSAFFSQKCVDTTDICWQPMHGTWALADGGLFGVGLGNSTAKWSWLPAADNDYIFAIIGEELGMLGCIAVIAIYIVLALAMLQSVRRTSDLTTRIVVGAIMTWILSQAFVNMAVVVGLMPVLGVPLPFLSNGGSALVTNLIAIGVALSLMRADIRERTSQAKRDRRIKPAEPRSPGNVGGVEYSRNRSQRHYR